MNIKDTSLAPLIRLLPQGITANGLTITRLILTLPLAMLLLMHQIRWALILFIIGLVLDFIDGTVARLRGQVSILGKLIDPVADKLFVLAPLLLLGAQYLPLNLLATIVVMESVFVFGAAATTSLSWLRTKKYHEVATSPLGQLKMTLYAVGTVGLFGVGTLPNILVPITFLFWSGVVVSIIDAVAYLVTSARKL